VRAVAPTAARTLGGGVYFTDKGIEELAERSGSETITLGWLAEAMRAFADDNPAFAEAVDRFAAYLLDYDDSA
jgi:Family of unknown function (DUF6104)